MDCQLQLENGPTFKAKAFGHLQSCSGELVFTTSMIGYTQALTDPSFCSQLLVFTYPLIGSYGVDPTEFESDKIWPKAVIMQSKQQASHPKSKLELEEWFKQQKVVGLEGLDTRQLVQYLRENGSSKARIIIDAHIDFMDINATNLVSLVSTSSIKVHSPLTIDYTVVAMDFGIKNNQIKCFLNRNIQVIQVPHTFDPASLSNRHMTVNNKQYTINGLFLSNGPGDPSSLLDVISSLSTLLANEQKSSTPLPIFGICLGHQLFALAAGGQTTKMQYGNRGSNIPVIDQLTNQCHISSQNHGYAVSTIPAGFKEWFVNANDHSNEGILHPTLPWASVQFHPEHHPGPHDTEFLFDYFKETMQSLSCFSKQPKVVTSLAKVKKVLVIGSGGLSIGQAGEFDYSGSQAIKALKAHSIYTILINPNIATIQTSKGLADKCYFLPITPQFVRKVIEKEKPDGIYCTFGGQTALQIGIDMKDEFESLGVKVLGTSIDTIIMTEDRDLFSQFLTRINEPTSINQSASTLKDALTCANSIGYPVICRAAYALGGLGSGFADNEQELTQLVNVALSNSPQVLLEKSFKGWQEFEYEVVRDQYDNCITVCNMENFDPLGIHTGDSIVVCPSQTLADTDHQRLRNTALHVIRELKVIGECNIQYAMNPITKDYFIIEVNARLSRSSALASKATGYPLAYVAAQLGLGCPLHSLKNQMTKTNACFEPSLDYIVVKMPRWDLRKFERVATEIGTSMKSVGEVMAIGKSFEETIQKAIRSVDDAYLGFQSSDSTDIDSKELVSRLCKPSDQRLFAIATAFHSMSIDKVHEYTHIDKWFLRALYRIHEHQQHLNTLVLDQLTPQLLLTSKQLGFSDFQIANSFKLTSEITIRKQRQQYSITPYAKQIDTVAAEFPCFSNYLYMTYYGTSDDTHGDKGMMILGSGVYRIGSSVEFDWCCCQTVVELRKHHIKTIMVNCNPETVSTDFDEVDKLYFEPLTLERIMDIYDKEQSKGVVVSMGGQAPNNLALSLYRHHVKIMGTSPEMIDTAENRYKFSRLLDQIHVDQPEWKELTELEDAYTFCKDKYPVLVRPSYVLSGAAMNVVHTQLDLSNYLSRAVQVSPLHPVVITKFIENAKEIECDAVAFEGQLVALIISEHVENAGVHSGDATLICPPQDLSETTLYKCKVATKLIANALNVTGPMNIQFIAKDDFIKVIECNVRCSRSFPFVSKVLDVNLIEYAVKAMCHLPVATSEFGLQLPIVNHVGVKVPKFSFNRLQGADPIVGVEMSATGEVACFGQTKYDAYLKALSSATFKFPKRTILISIGGFTDKQSLLPSIQQLHKLGYTLYGTTGTADFYTSHQIPMQSLELNNYKQEYSLVEYLQQNKIDLYINCPSQNHYKRPQSFLSNGYLSRRMAIDFAIPLITNIKCAKLFIEAITRYSLNSLELLPCDRMTSHVQTSLPLIGLDFDSTSTNQLPVIVTHKSNQSNTDTVQYSVDALVLFDKSAIDAKLATTKSKLVITTTALLHYVLLLSQHYHLFVHVHHVLYEELEELVKLQQHVGFTMDMTPTEILKSNNTTETLNSIDCIAVTSQQVPLLFKLPLPLVKEKLSAITRLFQLNHHHTTIFEDQQLSHSLMDGQTSSPHNIAIKWIPSQVIKQVVPVKVDLPIEIDLKESPVSNIFLNNHLTSTSHLTRQDLHHLFTIAHEMRTLSLRNKIRPICQGLILGICFFEPSTRTNCSFQSAWCKLGGQCIVLPPNTSQLKGESLLDTITTMATYSDILVMRHSITNSVQEMSTQCPIPLISAGDGSGEHPTQALLDVYTIREELGTVNNLVITIVGDLLHGRTVHSLVTLLCLYKVKFNLISPLNLQLPSQLISIVGDKLCVQQQELTSEILQQTDVLYVTRMQVERMDANTSDTKVPYRITPETMRHCKQHMIVMHPLPRVNEIDSLVDMDDRAAYIRQMRYGLYVRMALLGLISGKVN